MHVIDCDSLRCNSILAIFNEAIANSTALYDYVPWKRESMTDWFEIKRQGNYPVVGVTSNAGELMGFATYGKFRPRPAYKYTVEHSLYVAPEFRGQGLGKLLLSTLIGRAKDQDYHVLIGGIDSTNVASIALHKHFGFEHVGTMRQVGFKFGRWLDLCFYQLMLETPAQPMDGQ
jgi:L-amino acid N-acyltransferase